MRKTSSRIPVRDAAGYALEQVGPGLESAAIAALVSILQDENFSASRDSAYSLLKKLYQDGVKLPSLVKC